MISTIRHASIFDAQQNNIPCSIIGCGAIGSRVFEGLVSLGLTRIACYDFDTVEAHNVANQAYGNHDIGHPKVVALARFGAAKLGHSCPADLPASMTFNNIALPHADHPVKGVVFLAVDSFEARRAIAEQCLINNTDVFYVIDFRMGALAGNVLGFDPNSSKDTEFWLSTLGSDDEELAEVSPCGTSLSVGPTAAVVANLGVLQFMTWVVNPTGHEPDVNIFLRPMLFAQTFNRRAAA